ncbi:hypothetical protein lbkm_4097 [Lachnospiraceae bacterium KM106-2]|nr:hypothetical protein lbkm_4097 [Lachnospiraceae bacterium KM106-2]
MFENFISLGSNCLVASALGKYGLRSTSGPFDWCTSNFMEGVIPILENNFEDFLSYEHLVITDDKTVFDDIKYKINYNHDINESLEAEYMDMYQKYQRRITRFQEMVKDPTCFVRGCWSMEELSSLLGQEDRIDGAIKFNPKNEIVFVIPRFIYEQNPIKLNKKIFIVDTEISGFALGREEARGFFDTNSELVDFCIANYDTNKRKDNMIFDLQSELKIARNSYTDLGLQKQIENLKLQITLKNKANNQLNSRLTRWMKVLNIDYCSLEFPEKVSIYGCGAIGRVFYNHIKDHTQVIEFIDQMPRQQYYDSVPVVKPLDSNCDRDTLLIIIPSYDYDNIVVRLQNILGFQPSAISLESFLDKGTVIDENF